MEPSPMAIMPRELGHEVDLAAALEMLTPFLQRSRDLRRSRPPLLELPEALHCLQRPR